MHGTALACEQIATTEMLRDDAGTSDGSTTHTGTTDEGLVVRSCQKVCHMDVADACGRWLCPMGVSDGCVRWVCPMGVSDGCVG